MKLRLLPVSLIGALIALICCFTPLLPVVLTALGLTGLIGFVYNDAVLLPILALFLGLIGYALWQRGKSK